MRLSSISRMSAKRSRMIRKTSSPSSGRAGVSDTMGDGLLHAMHEPCLGTFGGEADGVGDGYGRRSSVRDHTHPVDAEQDGAAEGVGIVLGDPGAEHGSQRLM